MPDSNSITNIATSLAPAFAAGFAVQQGLEILDQLTNLDKKMQPTTKKGLAGIISLALGIVFSLSGIHVLSALASQVTPGSFVDIAVSALVISAGTEGFNSIMKFMGYKKDQADNAANPQNAGGNKQLKAT